MNRIFTVAILFALLTPPLAFSQTSATDVDDGKSEAKVQKRDRYSPDKVLSFKRTDEGELNLHVFEPVLKDADTKRPAIVFFFGGGWQVGSPKQFYEQARFFTDHGFVAFSAEYRVKSKHGTSPFECVEDGKSAIRWVRTHAAQLGIDADRIIAAGGSAGGHVAACTGTVVGHESGTENLDISSIPNAMILFNPVLDTTKAGFGLKQVGLARSQEVSPVHHLRKGLVPTLVFHGTGDKTVPFENAERFAKQMREYGNRCRLESFEGRGHGFFNGKVFRPQRKDTADYDRTMRVSLEFLTELKWLNAKKPAPENTKHSGLKKRRRPNIVLIYTDDQGYGDVSALNPNCQFETPNMDRLAREGIAFTNAHSADSVCTPSRYALLTGRYPWRTKMKRSVLGAESDCLIPDGRMTLPSLLRDNGYQTAMVGKWHLGMQFPGTPKTRDWTQPVLDMPLDKGFEYFYGIPASLNYGILAWFEGRYAAVPPIQYTNKKKNDRHVDYRIRPPYDATPAITKKHLDRPGFEIAEDFVDNQCLTRFTDKAIAWMKQATRGDEGNQKPFFLYLPLTSPHYPVCPLPEFHGRGNAGAYGEFVIETDHHLGRILKFLDDEQLANNTIVIFTSDNGPENSWRGRIEEFGHDSRGGFRGGKRSVYEGGHRVPFLIRGPNVIRSPGRVHEEIVGQTDLLATLAELIGAPLPDNAGEDSHSFLDVLQEANNRIQRPPLINHANGREFRYSITDNNWKLILPGPKRPAELYHLAIDRSETVNVAKQNPSIVNKLTESISSIVINGRSTPGQTQPNDTPYWEDLTWMTESDFRLKQAQSIR